MTEEQTPSETPVGEPTKKRLLLTGATGFLGRRILQDLAGPYEIIATHHGGLEDAPDVTAVHWEATKGAPEALLALFEPDAVLHLMALSRTEACASDPQSAQLLNVEITARLAEAALFRRTPFLFTSTDLVFDGMRGNYTEEDTPHPTSTYSRTKWEAEQALQKIFSRRPELLTIFRIGLSYGWGDEKHGGPAGWIISALNSGKTVDLFQDEYRSPLYQGDVSRALAEAIEKQISGLYHLGGPERMDRYTLGIRIAQRFELDSSLICARSVNDYQGLEPRSPDCSLVSAKFISTFGWKPVGIEEGLERMEGERK